MLHILYEKSFDDFENKKDQTLNEKLILVRKIFDKYNLISAVHYFMTYENERFNTLLPPLTFLSQEKGRALITELENLNFYLENCSVNVSSKVIIKNF